MKKPISYQNRKIIKDSSYVKPEEPKYGKLKLDCEIGIYGITCAETKSIYIGQSNNIPSRLRNHKSFLVNNKYQDRYPEWQFQFNELGEANFWFGTLYNCEPDKLLYWETYYLKLYKSEGWNIYNVQTQTYDMSIVNCSNEVKPVLERIIKLIEQGKIDVEQLNNALDNIY